MIDLIFLIRRVYATSLSCKTLIYNTLLQAPTNVLRCIEPKAPYTLFYAIACCYGSEVLMSRYASTLTLAQYRLCASKNARQMTRQRSPARRTRLWRCPCEAWIRVEMYQVAIGFYPFFDLRPDCNFTSYTLSPVGHIVTTVYTEVSSRVYHSLFSYQPTHVASRCLTR